MSAFELVFGMMSIITSLALTHILAGFVRLLRNAERVRFSASHALWAWSAFISTIGNWASYWELRSLKSWPAWTVLLTITLTIVQYIFCSFVTPDVPAEGTIDLIAFHQREYRRYIFAAGALVALALVFNLALGGAHLYADWLRDSAFSLAGGALVLLGYFVSARWAQIFSAAAMAALLTYFTVITCNIVAA